MGPYGYGWRYVWEAGKCLAQSQNRLLSSVGHKHLMGMDSPVGVLYESEKNAWPSVGYW